MTATHVSIPAQRRHGLVHRWPSALGILAAVASLVTGANRETLAITLAVALLCYLGAAALDRRWVSWAGIVAGSLVVVAAELVGLVWWAGVGIAAATLVVIGRLGHASRSALTAQTAALLGFGGLALVALSLDPDAGLVLAGIALAGHAVWDVIHYRRDEVVSRSLAEFCILLDILLGLGLIVITLGGSS
jgi:hypothetical protein